MRGEAAETAVERSRDDSIAELVRLREIAQSPSAGRTVEAVRELGAPDERRGGSP